MAFTKKEKNFILKNYQQLPLSKISEILNCSEKQISDFLISQDISSVSFSKSKEKSKFSKVKEAVIGEYEFKSFTTVFLENKNFFVILLLFIVLLYFRTFSAFLLSDEISMFQEYLSGSTNWWYLVYGSSINHYLSLLIFGYTPWANRMITLILHLLNLVLFYAIFRNFFSEKIIKITLVLLSVHSLIVEPITWIAANFYVFQGLGFLVAMYFSVTYERKGKWYFLLPIYYFIASFTLGGARANFAPLLLIAFDLFILKRSLKKELIVFSWLLLLIPIYPMLNKGQIESRVASLTTGPYLEKFAQTLPFTTAKSFEITVFPIYLALFHEETLNPYYYIYAKLLTLVFFGLTAFLFFKKDKTYFGLIAVALAFCIYIFSPVQVSWFVAERYMYLSVFIACLFWALLINYLNQKIANLGNVLFVGFFFLFLFVTFFRLEVWQTPVRLWEENVKVSPDSYRVRNNLAEAYNRAGDYEKAVKEYKESVRINPNFAEAYFNVSTAFLVQNKYSDAEPYLMKTIELNPSVVEAYLRLAIIKAFQSDFKNAYIYLNKAKELNASEEVINKFTQEIKKYEAQQKN